jgi:hypothetical protein
MLIQFFVNRCNSIGAFSDLVQKISRLFAPWRISTTRKRAIEFAAPLNAAMPHQIGSTLIADTDMFHQFRFSSSKIIISRGCGTGGTAGTGKCINVRVRVFCVYVYS